MPNKKNKRKKDKTTAIMLIVIGFVVILIAAAWWMYSAQEQSPTAEILNPTRVSLEEGKEAFDKGQAIFLDTRSLGSYQSSRIAGAVSLPEGDAPTRLNELDKEAWYILYCT